MDPDDGASHLRHPIRLVTLAGLAGLAVGVFGPWVEGTIGDGSHASLNGFSGAADGALQLVLGAALLLVLRSRSAATSDTLVVQSLPAFLGLGCLAYAVVAARTSDQLMLVLSELGAEPAISWGLRLDVLAAVVTAAGAVGTSALVMRGHPRRRRGPADAPVVDRALVVSVAVVIGAVLVGAVVGAVVGLVLLGSTTNGALVFFVGGGAAAGWLAADTGRRMARDWGSRDER